MILPTKYTDPQGIVWYPYQADFESPEGLFSVYISAISDEHAALQVEALKGTAKLAGRIEQFVGGDE